MLGAALIGGQQDQNRSHTSRPQRGHLGLGHRDCVTMPCVARVYTLCIQSWRKCVTEVGLRIRVDDGLRRDFIATCKIQDTTAAQVLRAFMRGYIEEHGEAVRQGRLFEHGPGAGQPLQSGAR